MKIVRYQSSMGEASYGVLEGDTVYAASGDPFTGGLTKGEAVGAVDGVSLLPPLRPGKIVCIGMNYLAHVTEIDPTRTVPEEPVMFMKPTTTLIGQGEEIKLANVDNRTDYEVELVVVIGKTAKDVSPEDATDYVLGYTIGNDVSDRVLQQKDGQWIRAKGFDTYCPLGPCIDTEVDPNTADGVKIISRLNGEVRQNNRTNDLIFPVRELISRISAVMTLEPGDVILTGTPEGVGALSSGDVIECEIEGIGVLRNPVGAK